MKRLIVQPLPGAPFDYGVTEEVTVIGRSSSCDLTLPSRYVSRQHARIVERDGQLWIEDLGSHNGTLLNQKPLAAPTLLEIGDRIQIGHFSLSLEQAEVSGAMLSASSSISSTPSGIWA